MWSSPVRQEITTTRKFESNDNDLLGFRILEPFLPS